MAGPHVSEWGPIIPGTPCICWEHRAGASRDIGRHHYILETEHVPWPDGVSRWRWRASCTCGRGRPSQWTYQSNSVAYHAWREHVARWS